MAAITRVIQKTTTSTQGMGTRMSAALIAAKPEITRVTECRSAAVAAPGINASDGAISIVTNMSSAQGSRIPRNGTISTFTGSAKTVTRWKYAAMGNIMNS